MHIPLLAKGMDVTIREKVDAFFRDFSSCSLSKGSAAERPFNLVPETKVTIFPVPLPLFILAF